MADEEKVNENKGENGHSDFADEWIEKGKSFADKAEGFVSEKFEKARNSETFGKISELFGKVENFMEEKSEEFQSGEMGAKIDALKQKAGDQAEELLSKVRETGLKIGDQVEETIETLKGKRDTSKNQDGSGI